MCHPSLILLSHSLTKLTRTDTIASSTALGQAGPSASASSSSSSGSGSLPSPTPSSSSPLSTGEKAGIAVACVAMAVAIVVGWWKKHQVLWFITCGRRGYKKSKKPQRAQAGHPLTNMGSGTMGNGTMGNGTMGNGIMGNGTMSYGGANNVGVNHVTNLGRWGNSGRP